LHSAIAGSALAANKAPPAMVSAAAMAARDSFRDVRVNMVVS